MSINHGTSKFLFIFSTHGKVTESLLNRIYFVRIFMSLDLGNHNNDNSLSKRGSFSKMKKRKKSANRDQTAPRQPLSGMCIICKMIIKAWNISYERKIFRISVVKVTFVLWMIDEKLSDRKIRTYLLRKSLVSWLTSGINYRKIKNKWVNFSFAA